MVTTPQYKSMYNLGDKLDLTGMVVEAFYSDGNSKLITGYTTSPGASPMGNNIVPSDKTNEPCVELVAGRDYVPEEVIALADSQEHAQEIAAAYGLELKSYSYGVAVFLTSDPEQAVELSSRMQQDGLPPLSLNLIYHTCEYDDSFSHAQIFLRQIIPRAFGIHLFMMPLGG